RVEDLPNKRKSISLHWAGPLVGPVQLHDMATGQPVRSILGDNGPRWHTPLSEDRSQLAAGGSPAEGAAADELRLIDLATGRERRTTLERHGGNWKPWFSPTGALLVLEHWNTPEGAKDLYLYDTASLRCLAKMKPPDSWPLWSADGNALLTFATDKDGKA